jgi:hypothetical protein
LRHCKAVVALVADEDLSVAPDEQLRQRPVVSETVALEVGEHAVDARPVLLEQPFDRGLAANRLSPDPARVSVAKQVRLFPLPALDIALDNRAVLYGL